MDTAQNYTIGTGTVIQNEFQQLFALGYSGTFFNLNYTDIRLAEGVKINIFFICRLNNNLREIDSFLLSLFYGCSNSRSLHKVRLLAYSLAQRFHGREEQYVTNGRAVGQEHYQTVDTNA